LITALQTSQVLEQQPCQCQRMRGQGLSWQFHAAIQPGKQWIQEVAWLTDMEADQAEPKVAYCRACLLLTMLRMMAHLSLKQAWEAEPCSCRCSRPVWVSMEVRMQGNT
jgi:hypothetical protein